MAEVLGITLGAIGLAADFIQVSEVATQTQALLSSVIGASKQPSSKLREAEARLARFKFQLDMLAQGFIDGNHESTSPEFNNRVQSILSKATTVLTDLRNLLSKDFMGDGSRSRKTALFVVPMRIEGIMTGLETLEVMIEFITTTSQTAISSPLVSTPRISSTGIEHHDAVPGGLPISHEDSHSPGSKTLTDDEATHCYPEGVNNKQKRFFAKMLFEPQPECQHHISVIGNDGGKPTTPAIVPLGGELLSTLSTGSTGSLHELMLILCETGTSKHNTLPFDRAAFVRIVDAIHVPLGFFQALLVGTPKFVHYAAENETQHAGFVLRTPSNLTENWTLALSWDRRFRVMRGIIHGMQLQEMTRLAMHIGDTQRESAHPVNIPLILCEMLVESDSNRVKLHALNLHKVEKRTNFHGYTPSRPVNNASGQAKLPEQDFAEMTQSLNLIISRLAFHEMRLHAIAVFIDEIIECLSRIGAHTDHLNPTRKSGLLERLAHLKTEQRALLLGISCNQKIAQSQLQIVYSLIAQRDNKDNLAMATTQTDIAETTKEDSFAMRTIAIMSIAFLPGTLVSSFFSMDMFDWQAPQGASVLSSRFWIYWAVTVPLTLLVFSVCWDLGKWLLRDSGERIPSYRRRLPKTAGEDEEQQMFGEVGLRLASFAADAPLKNRGLTAQIARADTVLQGPMRGYV